MRLTVDDGAAVQLVQILAAEVLSGPVLLLAADAGEADRLEQLCRGVAEILGDCKPVIRVPAVGGSNRQYWVAGDDAVRCAAMQRALDGESVIYVCSSAGLQASAFPPEVFRERSFTN
ncbi:MAG: hypothetical protein ACOC0L_02170, partial [bacterium]